MVHTPLRKTDCNTACPSTLVNEQCGPGVYLRGPCPCLSPNQTGDKHTYLDHVGSHHENHHSPVPRWFCLQRHPLRQHLATREFHSAVNQRVERSGDGNQWGYWQEIVV